MDKIEKIRQEIKRLKSTNPSEYNYQNAEGYIWALDDLLSFIDSLQQEQPKIDLEREIDAYLEPIKAWQIQEAPYTSIENTARHFYQLGLNARKEE